MAVGGSLAWPALGAVKQRVFPDGSKQLAQLGRVPHPDGALEVGHRTVHGTLNGGPSAWLTYQLPVTGPLPCQAVIAAFAANGIHETYVKQHDPVAAYCPPKGIGMAPYCMYKVVCFTADFNDVAHRRYTLGTGPNTGG